MSKYDPLWAYVKERDEYILELTFEEAEKVLGFPLKHSLLTYKKELLDYGFEVVKILKGEQVVIFRKLD